MNRLKGQMVEMSVAVVEDNRNIRAQLGKVLSKTPDIKCIGMFATVESALPRIKIHDPDVVIMDIELPGMSGIQGVAEIKKNRAGTKVIMFSAHEDNERIFCSLKAGANGYLLKPIPPKELIEAIRDVHNGGAPLSANIARKIVGHFHRLGIPDEHIRPLSPRERQVLDLMAMGLTYREISNELSIAHETIRTHVKKFCRKMNARSRIEAVAKYRYY